MIVTLTNNTSGQVYVSLLRRSLAAGESAPLQSITVPQLEQEIQLLSLVKSGSLLMQTTPEITDAVVSESVVVADFAPARTIRVATSWPVGSDPLVCFTTITSALTRAAAMTPTLASPVSIIVYPGTYADNVTLIPFVAIRGATGPFITTTISGTVTWTPTGSTSESAWLYFMNLTNAAGLTVNTTGKTGGQTTLLGFNCNIQALTYTGRSAVAAATTRDFIQLWNCLQGNGVFSFTTALVEWNSCRVASMTYAGSARFTIAGGTTNPAASAAWSIGGTSVGFVNGLLCTTPWNLASGTSVAFSGCDIKAVITAASGASADVRGSNYNAAANLVGPGTINRDAHLQSSGVTIAGANAILFTVPFTDANYNVTLQLVSGPGNAAATVSAKAGTGFTINDSVGGNTWDCTVTHL